ncbi:MAG: LytR/AlgR family response regulator transcription factor [Saprospiraceae bacterium]
MKVRTIIVEDEENLREGIKSLLALDDEIEVIGEAASVVEAKRLIETLKPDFLILDIKLEDGNSFTLLQEINYIDFSLIFITAFNDFAIKAFRFAALDYLLKPIDPEELKEALRKVKQHQCVLQEIQINQLKKTEEESQIIIRIADGHVIVRFDELVRCQADEGYTHFFMSDGSRHIISKSLKEYEQILPTHKFIRTHQSHIINKTFVERFDVHGVQLKNSKLIPISTRKKKGVLEWLRG